MADEKRFLDRAGLKQALELIKGLIATTKADLHQEIVNSSTNGGSALETAKATLAADIATNATAIATNATAITNLSNTVATNKSNIEQALSDAKDEIAANLADAKDEIAANLANAQLKFQVVDALPLVAEADPRVVYLVLDNEPNKTADGSNKYIEYLVQVENGVNVRYEEIGDTQMSLEDYAKSAVVEQQIADAVEETLNTVETTNYVKNENFLTNAEVIALFEDSCIVVKEDGSYVKYENALDAIADAQAGETVVVKEDLELPAGFTVAEDVIIDLNGFEMKEA